MTIGDLKCHFKNKNHLNQMIERFGERDAAHRLAWLHDCSVEEAETLICQFLTDDYVDDKGVKGGDFFWGDL
jgi:hypothetical protein